MRRSFECLCVLRLCFRGCVHMNMHPKQSEQLNTCTVYIPRSLFATPIVHMHVRKWFTQMLSY